MKLGKTYFSGSITFDEGTNVIGPSSSQLTGSFSGSMKGTIVSTGHIIPAVSGAYDLGSTAFPFKDLYITQNSLKFVDSTTGSEIGRISVNSNTGDIKLLNTKNLTEEQKASLTAETAGAEALSPVSASALWVSQSIFAGHENTNIGHEVAPFHTLYTQFISGSSATLTGDLKVGGTVTAQEFHTEFVSASIIYQSGSTQFGDSADDTHVFTGNVGIGTTSPNNKLTVASTDPNTLSIYRDLDVNVVGAAGMYINMGAKDGASFKNAARIIGALNNSTTGALYIDTLRSGTLTTAVTILGDGNVGIGTNSPSDKLVVYGGNLSVANTNTSFSIVPNYAGQGALLAGTLLCTNNVTNNNLNIIPDSGGNVSSVVLASYNGSSWYNMMEYGNVASGVPNLFLVKGGGNVGIGTTSPVSKLDVNGTVTATGLNIINDRNYYQRGQARLTSATNNANTLDIIVTDSVNRIYSNYYGGGTDNPITIGTYANYTNQLVLATTGDVGVGTTSPKGKLHVKQGPLVIDSGPPNYQLALLNSGTAGTLSGQLTVTIPNTDGGGGSVGYGGYSCEIYLSGYSGVYCHAWFSGYTNAGITPGETAILRSSGGFSVSQSGGDTAQSIVFVVDYPVNIHPTARIIFNKAGDPNNGGYNFNNVTITWS